MFPKTKDLAAQRRKSSGATSDRESWLRDIRDTDSVLDDDPLNTRA